MQDYFQLEGFAYQIVPIKTTSNDDFNQGRVDTDKMYDNVTKKFRWSGFDDPRVYVDENHLRMATNIRSNLTRLANALIDEDKKDKATEILSLIDKKFPSDRVAHNYFSIFLAEAYYRVGNIAKGDAVLKEFAESNLQELNYYMSLTGSQKSFGQEEARRNLAIYGEIYKMAGQYNRSELLKNYDISYQGAMKQFQFFE
jgi:predicted Zn-dependent protease